jgi:hypothetical protein
VNIITPNTDRQITIEKKHISALTAEIALPLNDIESFYKHEYLKYFDILDFPSLIPFRKIPENELTHGDNLNILFRDTKIQYLFEKYSNEKRASALLFLHSNRLSTSSTVGFLLHDWISNNIGYTPEEREMFEKSSKISPLFVVSTCFNKDLEYRDETHNTNLGERWQYRFRKVLYEEIVQAYVYEWFDNWRSNEKKAFDNMYLLRNFNYSRMIFEGWDPNLNTPEREIRPTPKYQNFMEKLKESFVKDEFVKQHFVDPETTWQQSATLNNDGTEAIILGLNILSHNLEKARYELFNRYYKNLCSILKGIMPV